MAPMTVATWWQQRRLGVFVHANLATVPAWAPIGQYAEWYRSHLGEPVADVILHPSPMAEVLAHHRDRWEHVARYEDFWPLLDFDRFDPDAWAGLAAEAGAGYTVMVTKHHDGLCWWDAPGTRRTVLHEGPRRDVFGEYAAAARRAGLVVGTYYSLLDWADPRYPGPAYVDEVLHPHVLDLVERHGSQVLWGDGHWGHGPDTWRSDELLDRARALGTDLVVNDRWWSTGADVRTFEYETPDDVLTDPWELCRGLGPSFGHNRTERAEHLLDAAGIVALYTEVLAKGGNLLLGVGPAADGTIPELQATPLREAGHWIRRHDLLARSVPWTRWGDAHSRHLCIDDALHAIDLGGRGRLDGLGRAAGRVLDVCDLDGAPVAWEQFDDHLAIRRLDRLPVDLAVVYRVALEAPAARPPSLFGDAPLDEVVHDPGPIPLAPLLAEAGPGQVVQLGEATYLGPAHVPDGVTLRGLGADRTVIDGVSGVALTVGAGARVEHLTVSGCGTRIAWFALPAVRMVGRRGLLVGCTVEGHVMVDADDGTVRACRANGVVARGVDRCTVSRSVLHGNRWDVGVELDGGTGHLVESSELREHLAGVTARGTTNLVVRGNAISGRWWGIRLVGVEGAEVTGTTVTATMRAVDVDGGSWVTVHGNVVLDGDSGCIVQQGATEVTVAGNRWERCRIGVLVWDAGEVVGHDNAAVDLHEPEHQLQTGP
jgi:alpha-L-fucosidase